MNAESSSSGCAAIVQGARGGRELLNLLQHARGAAAVDRAHLGTESGLARGKQGAQRHHREHGEKATRSTRTSRI